MKPIRRRILAVALGVAALTSSLGAPSAIAAHEPKATVYGGACQLSFTFHLNGPIGFATFGRPGYWIEVNPYPGGVMPCVLEDTDLLDPLRNTIVSAEGWSDIFDCDAVVARGSWNQEWLKSNGVQSPIPVYGGRHNLYGTWDNWVLEAEGVNVVQFAGAANLRVDPLWVSQHAAACSNGSLWDVHTIGTFVVEDPVL